MTFYLNNSDTFRLVCSGLASIAVASAVFMFLGNSSVAHAEVVESKPPLRKLNPKPSRGYEIIVNLANAPGPFLVGGSAKYAVENHSLCGEKIWLAGTFRGITSTEPFELTKVSETTYKGTMYADQILDGNYYGRGVCRWKLVSVSASFRGMPENVSTRYIMFLDESVVETQGLDTRYYWRGYYPRAKMDRFSDIGQNSLKEDVIRDHGNEFFTITMKAKALKP